MRNASEKFRRLSQVDIDRVIEMAWEDRTPFEAIYVQFGLTEQDVIHLMRSSLHPVSFKRWRARVQGRAAKHLKLVEQSNFRFKCSRQKVISLNKISKK